MKKTKINLNKLTDTILHPYFKKHPQLIIIRWNPTCHNRTKPKTKPKKIHQIQHSHEKH